MYQGLAIEIDQVMPAAFATGLFVSTASFVQPIATQGPTGNPTGGYTPIAGLQNIPAMNAPASTGMIGNSSDETRGLAHIEAKRVRRMVLNGYYPLLDTGFSQGAGMGWEVQVTDGNGSPQLYDFLGGEGDSQRQMTRVEMMLVTV
jgi:hypothetical protein